MKQREDVEELRLALESKIKLEVESRIRDQLRLMAKNSVRERVQEKVQEEVSLLFSLYKIFSHFFSSARQTNSKWTTTASHRPSAPDPRS